MERIKERIKAGSDRNRHIKRYGSPLACPSLQHISQVNTVFIMGGNEGGGRGTDLWSLIGVRPSVQKSPTDPGAASNTSGGFSLQSYLGLQKSTTLDSIKTQVNLGVENPPDFKSSKQEATGPEGRKVSVHKLKPRDMNVLTPSGF